MIEVKYISNGPCHDDVVFSGQPALMTLISSRRLLPFCVWSLIVVLKRTRLQRDVLRHVDALNLWSDILASIVG